MTDAVARATAEIARQVGAAAIVCATRNGGTARAVAQNRPNTRILGVTTEIATYRRLALTWGVTPALITAGRRYRRAAGSLYRRGAAGKSREIE